MCDFPDDKLKLELDWLSNHAHQKKSNKYPSIQLIADKKRINTKKKYDIDATDDLYARAYQA